MMQVTYERLSPGGVIGPEQAGEPLTYAVLSAAPLAFGPTR
jgi:hypothetical protein